MIVPRNRIDAARPRVTQVPATFSVAGLTQVTCAPAGKAKTQPRVAGRSAIFKNLVMFTSQKFPVAPATATQASPDIKGTSGMSGTGPGFWSSLIQTRSSLPLILILLVTL